MRVSTIKSKWIYQTGCYTHWVVEEPIPGLITVVR